MRVCAVLAVSSLLGMSFMATPAGAELLYASMGSGSDSRVVTYDISLSSSSAVQASLQTFTSGTTRVNTPGGIAFSPTGDTAEHDLEVRSVGQSAGDDRGHIEPQRPGVDRLRFIRQPVRRELHQ